MNVNYDLKFGSIFKIVNCFTSYFIQENLHILFNSATRNFFRDSVSLVIHSILIYKKFNNNNAYLILTPNNAPDKVKRLDLGNTPIKGENTEYLEFPMMSIFTTGIKFIKFYNTNTKSRTFSVDIILSYI